MILLTSKFRHFNAKFRFVKFGAVKKLLFALQTTMYRNEMIPEVISALTGIARQSFSTEATIKPIVSFLAANLERQGECSSLKFEVKMPTIRCNPFHTDPDNPSDNDATSLSSPALPFDKSIIQERAEQVLEAFVSILSSDAHMIKFKSALPAPRICLLLLGSKPAAVVAAQILNLVGLMMEKDSSYALVFFFSQSVLPTPFLNCRNTTDTRESWN